MLAAATLAVALTATAPTQVDPASRKIYEDLLAKHVKNGRVDYKAIEAQDLAKLDAYVAAVGKAKLSPKKQARIGFYIDAYNALVIRSVIKNGRPRSVLDVKGFFNAQEHTVAGQKMTLDALEKKHLNPFAKDPRTHFVLVCAAVGCPVLESRPYCGSNLDKRMDRATRRYLKSNTGARVKDGAIDLSKIFDWYKADFGGPDGVLAFVKKHLPEADAKRLGDRPKVGYIDYNWTLNQR